MSESAREKLSRYEYARQEYQTRLGEHPDDEHGITLAYSPILNMLAREFTEQMLEDEGR